MWGELLGMKADIEQLKTAFGNSLKVGPVEEIDATKGYRLKLGEDADGAPWLSPWLPHPETGKTSVPLKKGQIVGVMSPTGDMRQGLVFRAGYSAENKSPNEDMSANVFEDAGVRIEVADGAVTVTAGSVTLTVSGDGVAISGGQVTHNGKNIGDTHVHGGVERGGVDTFGPH